MVKLVGIGEHAISSCTTDTLKTLALASCIAIVLYEPRKQAAGMAHIALPYPATAEQGLIYPYRYASTALPLLLHTMSNRFKSSHASFDIKLYGGADSIRDSDVFNIGRKNIDAIMGTLADLKLRYSYADLGGNKARTIELHVASGAVRVDMLPINI